MGTGCHPPVGRMRPPERQGPPCGHPVRLDIFLTTVDGFKEKMTELGYIEGKNILYDFRRSSFDTATERSVLRDFVEKKLDVILVFPTEAALEAKAAIRGTDIPMVFCQTNIEGIDLIKNLREPGGNMTGVRYPGPDLALKRFEIMRELVPRARRFWVPYWKDTPIVPSQLELLRPHAVKEGIVLVECPARDASDLEADLKARAKAADIGIDAILLISEPLARTSAAFPRSPNLRPTTNCRLAVYSIHLEVTRLFSGWRRTTLPWASWRLNKPTKYSRASPPARSRLFPPKLSDYPLHRRTRSGIDRTRRPVETGG